MTTNNPAICIINKTALAQAVTAIYKATKDAKDAWRHMVTLKASKGALLVKACGEAAQIEQPLPCEGRATFTATVDVISLHRALRSRFSDTTTLEIHEQPGALLIFDIAWKNYEHRIPERLPTGPRKISIEETGASGTLALGALRHAVDYVAHARSTDETRRHLCGLQIRCMGGGLKLYTTDGHRLSSAFVPVVWASTQQLPDELALHADTAELLAALPTTDEPATLQISTAGIALKIGTFTVFTAESMLNGVFPCEQVIPANPAASLLVEWSALVGLKQLAEAQIKQADNNHVDFTFGPDGAYARGSTTKEPQPLTDRSLPAGTVRICARYLHEALRGLHLSAALSYTDDLSPFMVRGTGASEHLFDVIMPVRR